MVNEKKDTNEFVVESKSYLGFVFFFVEENCLNLNLVLLNLVLLVRKNWELLYNF